MLLVLRNNKYPNKLNVKSFYSKNLLLAKLHHKQDVCHLVQPLLVPLASMVVVMMITMKEYLTET